MIRLSLLVLLLASCHPAEVVLRNSKTHNAFQTEEAQDITVVKRTEKSAAPVLKPTFIQNNPCAKIEGDTNMSIALRHDSNLHYVKELLHADNSSHPYLIKPKQISNKPFINHNHSQAKIAQPNGIVSSTRFFIGLCAVVCLVFGVVLFFVGGIIVDTIGALLLAFGLVFVLIWLVLSLLQGLFSVIL